MMSAFVNPNPSPSIVPKQERHRMKKLSTSVVTAAEDDNRGAELPALRERSGMTDRPRVPVTPLQNCFIPDELLTTLTSTAYPQDRLGPLKLIKSPKVCRPHCRDSVWHHSAGRRKFQYFLDQPTSLSGAGRDISFLCDAMVSQRQRFPLPPMTDREPTLSQDVQKEKHPMETLIPEEYHIVKNKGVKALQCYDDKFTVLLEDEQKKLLAFPSMRPSGRLEAMQLMRVMDEMMDKAGVNQELTELTGLSQMQGLLDLVRVEQNIYNIVFHEVIRQVSVECVERGQLLAKLRQRYVALLDRIPRQLKGLHTEMLAQRALDRRLAEEILCFKTSVAQLNEELCQMREHDEHASRKAETALEELAKALDQSQKSSDIVAEYHNLYEMQRRRLEAQVAKMTHEKDLWSKVTYSLALKVIRVYKLQLVGRLHVSEQMWAKTAEHLTIYLTTKDSGDLTHVVQLTDEWKEHLSTFMENILEAEQEQRKSVMAVQQGMAKWHSLCGTNLKSADIKFEKESVEELFDDLKQWAKALTMQCERYGGETLLSGQETLTTLARLQETWVEVGLQLFRRHPALDGEPPAGQEAMRQLRRAITELHKQLGIRINGESGIHRQLISLVGGIESWVTRMKAVIGRPEGLPYCDWLKLVKALDSWMTLTEEVVNHVDSTKPDHESVHQKPHTKIEINDVLNMLREFLSSQMIFFNCENLRLSEEVSSVQTLLIRWMVDLLLQMVPDLGDDQEPPLPPSPESNVSVEGSLHRLEEDAKTISQKLDYFTRYIARSCQLIVEKEIQRGMCQDDAETEMYELIKLQRECGEWVETCGILLSDVKGSPVELQVSGQMPRSASGTPSATSMESLNEADVHATVAVPTEALSEVQTETEQDGIQEQGEENEEEEKEKAEIMGEDPEGGSIMRLIGHDGSIIQRAFGEDVTQLSRTDEQVMSPRTPNAQQAFRALAALTVLQQEQLATEARAQSAEERALVAENALQTALVKIQDLERQLQGKPSLENKGSTKTVTVTPKNVDPPETKAVSQKPRPNPKQTKTTRKR